MKTNLLASAALAVSLAVAAMAPQVAHANAIIEVDFGSIEVNQVANEAVSQGASSAILAVGSVTNSTFDSTAVNAVGLVTSELTLAGSNAWGGDLDIGLTKINTLINDTLTQSAASSVGMGAVSGSTVASLGANVALSATPTVTIGCPSC